MFTIVFTNVQVKSKVLLLFNDFLFPIDFQGHEFESIKTKACYQHLLNDNKFLAQQLAAVYNDALNFQESYSLNPVSITKQVDIEANKVDFDYGPTCLSAGYSRT